MGRITVVARGEGAGAQSMMWMAPRMAIIGAHVKRMAAAAVLALFLGMTGAPLTMITIMDLQEAVSRIRRDF